MVLPKIVLTFCPAGKDSTEIRAAGSFIEKLKIVGNLLDVFAGGGNERFNFYIQVCDRPTHTTGLDIEFLYNFKGEVVGLTLCDNFSEDTDRDWYLTAIVAWGCIYKDVFDNSETVEEFDKMTDRLIGLNASSELLTIYQKGVV